MHRCSIAALAIAALIDACCAALGSQRLEIAAPRASSPAFIEIAERRDVDPAGCIACRNACARRAIFEPPPYRQQDGQRPPGPALRISHGPRCRAPRHKPPINGVRFGTATSDTVQKITAVGHVLGSGCRRAHAAAPDAQMVGPEEESQGAQHSAIRPRNRGRLRLLTQLPLISSQLFLEICSARARC